MVDKALAMGAGVQVTFVPRIRNVEPRFGAWRDGATGWATDVTPCIKRIDFPNGNCQITIRAEMNATPNLLRLSDLGGVVGVVPVG